MLKLNSDSPYNEPIPDIVSVKDLAWKLNRTPAWCYNYYRELGGVKTGIFQSSFLNTSEGRSVQKK